MAEFSKLVTTKKGQALIAKNWAGTADRPSFTKIIASQQTLKVEDLEELTALDIVQEAEVSRVTRTNEVAVMVESAFSNKDLKTGYHMRVLGLYALDPDEGEILYSAAVELSGNDWMPPYNGVTLTGAYIQLITTVGNSEDVSLMVNPAALATIADIMDLQKQINDITSFIGMDGHPSKVGKSMAGEEVEISQGVVETAKAGAEIFNSYAPRTFGTENDSEEVLPLSGNVASGKCAHAEGEAATATGDNSHAEGYRTLASAGSAHAEGGAELECMGSTASAYAAHAEGISSTASAQAAHAEGWNTLASGMESHAEGSGSVASGMASHAEGFRTLASEDESHAEGSANAATGRAAHAEGGVIQVLNETLGKQVSNLASGVASHAEGCLTTAGGYASHAGGYGTVAIANYQTAIGQLNLESSQETDRFIIGKGDNRVPETRANCFRVTDTGTYASGSYNASGADYGELFQWQDGNLENEDRAGRFVTLDGEEIRLAGQEDSYILGIVSATPSVVGDVHDDQWHEMYATDIFGRPIWEETDLPEETMEAPDPEDTGKTVRRVIRPAHTERRQKRNPEYDPQQKYQPRTQRPEWDAVGLLGKLVVVDDGSCQVNGWCMPWKNGLATESPHPTRFRVMARLDRNHVRVMML